MHGNLSTQHRLRKPRFPRAPPLSFQARYNGSVAADMLGKFEPIRLSLAQEPVQRLCYPACKQRRDSVADLHILLRAVPQKCKNPPNDDPANKLLNLLF